MLDTARFHLRELTGADASERYVSWFSDPVAARHITAAASTTTVAGVRTYIEARVGRDDVLFLGIFDRTTGLHIGNIKFEPIDVRQGYAIMGILIGDPEFRGRGVAGEVLAVTSNWLKANRGITQILLGVSADNVAAIRAYERAGFVRTISPHMPCASDAYVAMVLQL